MSILQKVRHALQYNNIIMDLHSQLREKGTLPDIRSIMTGADIFIKITLINGYVACVKIPINMNQYMIQERFSIEMTLLLDGNIGYSNDLAYGNVRNLGTFNNIKDKTEAIAAIEAEYHRLMTLLSAQQ